MNKKSLFITLISIICLTSFGFHQITKSKSEHFLSIDNNINNEDLQYEIERLKKEFDSQRNTIIDSYETRIKSLKNERKKEINSLKKTFKIRRDNLFKEYGIEQNNSKGKQNELYNSKKPLIKNKTKTKITTKSERKKRKIKSNN